MNRLMCVGLTTFALLGAACGDADTDASPEAVVRENPGDTTAAPPAEAPLVAPTAASVPIPEDFEAEMAQAVTPENYRAQLDAVLAELDAS